MARPSARSPAVRSYLGARLREARLGQGVGLRELARRIGVSPAHISQIETGKAEPSATTLFAIASELHLSLSEIAFNGSTAADKGLAPTAEPSEVIHHPDDRPRVALGGGVSWERLTPRVDPNIDFLYLVYDVGAESTQAHALLRHGGHEYGYVLSGRLEVTIGSSTYEIGPGDSIGFACTTPHRFANAGNEPVHAIWFVADRPR